MHSISKVVQHTEEHFSEAVDAVCHYLRIPAISCDPEHHEDVRQLAAEIRDDLEALGLHNARVLQLDNALPSVAAEWLEAGPDKPTVLIYGHLDIQPVKGEVWASPPHEPVIRNGRLYGRGSADDMGGWVSHIAALRAWFATQSGPPCNIRMFIEGEEEIGSPNLERYMDTYPEAFASDVMILTDCENPSEDIPGLTVSLRGLIEMKVSVEALSADVHSGLWGNMVPDAPNILIKLISRLLDDHGRMRVGLVDVDDEWKQKTSDVPLNAEIITQGGHLLEGVTPLPLAGRTEAEWLWRQPSLAVVATTLPHLSEKKNAIRARAEAVLSIRVPPGVNPKDLYDEIEEILTAAPPSSVQVSTSAGTWSGEGWLYTPQGPYFEAADRAYEKAWGHHLVHIGVGGSIPFVAMFGKRFGDMPLILNGVLDPLSTAHGPNESMHLGIFRKAITANVHLLDEISKLKP